jgi:hypothetical protein
MHRRQVLGLCSFSKADSSMPAPTTSSSTPSTMEAAFSKRW